MLNVKDQVYAALCEVAENVVDVYPKEWVDMPTIQYMEEENKVVSFTDMKEQMAQVRYRIDIWHDGFSHEMSEMAVKVDKQMAGLGLKRIQCQDVEDPSRLKHKLMRYEMVIDVNTEQVYHTN